MWGVVQMVEAWLSVGSGADGGGLAPNGSEGCKTPHAVNVMSLWSLVSWSLADKKPEPLKLNLGFDGTIDAGQLGLENRCD